jgi:hypothetical protein
VSYANRMWSCGGMGSKHLKVADSTSAEHIVAGLCTQECCVAHASSIACMHVIHLGFLMNTVSHARPKMCPNHVVSASEDHCTAQMPSPD